MFTAHYLVYCILYCWSLEHFVFWETVRLNDFLQLSTGTDRLKWKKVSSTPSVQPNNKYISWINPNTSWPEKVIGFFWQPQLITGGI
jgi:hypothetical protein